MEPVSDERPLKPLDDFPLNVEPLLPLPKERVEESELEVWTDWLPRELKLRDESLLEDMLRDDDDPLLPLLVDDRLLWLDRSFLSSLSRAIPELVVRKTNRSPAATAHLITGLRRMWGTFLFERLIQPPTLP